MKNLKRVEIVLHMFTNRIEYIYWKYGNMKILKGSGWNALTYINFRPFSNYCVPLLGTHILAQYAELNQVQTLQLNVES